MNEMAFEMSEPRAQIIDGLPIVPKGSRIVIKRNAYKETGRIILSDNAKPKPTTGIVVGYGPDVPDGFVEIGEQVIFGLYAGIPVVLKDPYKPGDSVEYVVCVSDEIMATILPGTEIDEARKV